MSYAASFGKGEITKEHLETITPWVKQFTHVSVREAEGVDICRQMGVNAQHLLDPTLLLNECDYPHQKLKIKRTYVFVYWLNLRSKSDVRWSEIEAFAKQSGNDLKICAVQGSQYLFSNAELVYPSPVAWLSYYQQAQYIVTNTFHGTVFAIIHRKPFLCILQSGASANQNTRMKSLLFSLGLEDRILKLEENIATAMSKSIDWNQVTDTIQLCRKKSDAFFSFLDD
ncbi:polysaccharide pyruvyl transferase family protein [Phocaeicola vulgatus]|nr:polysaccharide pyruvyl transferase family protein [Phocaeicola vulgatus]MCG0272051.1 polysaccharide pyruvyl transferase family protein [Phocaeicola vulgatus]